MARLDIIILLSVLAVTQGGVIKNDSLHPRIVNGQKVAKGEIPYQVAIHLRNPEDGLWYHQCGGSILNEYYVLTAAHCIAVLGFKIDDFRVSVGTIDNNNFDHLHAASMLIRHQNYVADTLMNDIALIKVKTPFQFSDTVRPVELPAPYTNINVGKTAVVSGWGALSFHGPKTNFLQKASLAIADQGYCRSAYAKEHLAVFDSQICAHDKFTSRGSCNGDSGGPLTVDGTLIGIVSWALECALVDHPSVFTRVSNYIDWIENNAV